MSDEVTALVPIAKKQRKDKQFWPTVEKKEHRQMYIFYEGLGAQRTLDKVAKEFNKSRTYVAVLSRAFSWLDRVKQGDRILADPIIMQVTPQVNRVRTELVTVVEDISDTFREMSTLSKQIKSGDGLSEDGKMLPAHADRYNRLAAALGVYGIQMKDPKSLRDLLSMLKEVVRFNEDSKPAPAGPTNLTQISAPGAQLILKDD